MTFILPPGQWSVWCNVPVTCNDRTYLEVLAKVEGSDSEGPGIVPSSVSTPDSGNDQVSGQKEVQPPKLEGGTPDPCKFKPGNQIILLS